MTDDRNSGGDRNVLAAEYALGMLTGNDLAQARQLLASDAQFQADVGSWTGRFALLLNEVEDSVPPRQLWDRIAAEIGAPKATTNVVTFRRRLNFWRGTAIGMTALAASLALLLVLRPAPVAIQQPAPAVPMVAVLADEKEAKLVANWEPERRQLVLAVSGTLSGDPAHSHELWVIPVGGKPISLGVLSGSKQSHVRLADALAKLLQAGATIAISVEPRGGSPTGSPTGPVIASGELKSA